VFEVSVAAVVAAFALVVLAEMGDKTQLLAMTFAAKYNPYKVLLAVFLATVGINALAVLAGQLLTTVIPLDIISFAASLSFIGFGLWTVHGESLVSKERGLSRFGIVATVAAAFFLAELGDKTQLATISLAAQYNNALGVLIGSTLGMLVADTVGIVIGVVFCRRIPQRVFKWFSVAIFVAFGLVGVYEVLTKNFVFAYAVSAVAALAALTVALGYWLSKHQKLLPEKVECKQNKP
jgi:Ca2+/H+ antiporter, TMEM165/GDT1 family